MKNVLRLFAYSEAGETAAREMLELQNSRYLTAAPYEIKSAKSKDLRKRLTVEDLKMPDEPDKSCTTRIDPAFKDNEEFEMHLDELSSLTDLADTFPYSWLWQCQEAQEAFSNSVAFKLQAALRLNEMQKTAPASGLAGEILEKTDKSGWFSFRAYSLLAHIYSTRDDHPREIAALTHALSLNPRDPFIHRRLVKVYDSVKCPNRSDYHRLMSWYIFPSQRDIITGLIDAGLLPDRSDTDLDTAALFSHASPAVVLISHDLGNGTGFMVSREGMLLTNHHVVEGADELTVKFIDADTRKEHTVPTRVIAKDARRDIALLQCEVGELRVKPLVMADSDLAKTGDSIVAIGNPGFGTKVLTHTATEGIISSENRMLAGQKFIQTSAAVNPGNSGGPLLNRSGKVVGMVTLKAHLENVGFAVPANDLVAFIEKNASR